MYRSLVIKVPVYQERLVVFLLTSLKSPGQRKEDQMGSSEVFQRGQGEEVMLFHVVKGI